MKRTTLYPGKIITTRMLEKEGACEDQVELFKKTFHSRTTLTLAHLTQAAQAGLDIFWFSVTFLTPDQFDQFLPLRHTASERRDEATNDAYNTFLANIQPLYEAWMKSDEASREENYRLYYTTRIHEDIIRLNKDDQITLAYRLELANILWSFVVEERK